jgi:serine/threonine protein kinase
LTVFYLLRALNVERLIGLLRAGNLAVTVLSSLILVSQGLSLTNYPLTALGLLAFFLAITLFFQPNPRGFAIGLFVGGLAAPLLAFQFYFGYFLLSPLPYLAFTLIVMIPLFPKALSHKFVVLRRLNATAYVFFALAVTVAYYLGGLNYYFFYFALLVGLGVTIATSLEEFSSQNVLSRVAIPYLASQVYLSLLIYEITHLGMILNPLLVLNGVLQESWLYFPGSVFLLVSSILSTSYRGLRYLPEAMISVSLAGILSSAFLTFLPLYVPAFTIPALAGSVNELDRNELLSYAFASFVSDRKRAYADVSELYRKRDAQDDLACALLSAGLCDKAIWVHDNFGADLLKCDRKPLIHCLNVYGYVPKDVNRLITGVAGSDPVAAYSLAEKYSSDPRVKELLPSLRQAALERLRLSWDPTVWIGANLNGYKVVNYIGKGSFMYVLKAVKDGKLYAIKIPILDSPLARAAYQDLLDEYSQLREINRDSNNVVQIVDFRPNEEALRRALQGDLEAYLLDPPYLVVELLEGGSADDLTKDDNLFYSDEWEEIVKEVTYRIALILSELHDKGWIHLDVKPTNVLFDVAPGATGKEVLERLRKGEVRVKLSDVASARRFWERAHHFTPEFSSVDQVEVVLGLGNVFPGLDVFSLGATAYYMMTRRLPLSQLKPYYDEAIGLYESGAKREELYGVIERARLEYVKVYSDLDFNVFEDKKFGELIKRMMHPNSTLRPTSHEVVSELERMRRK